MIIIDDHEKESAMAESTTTPPPRKIAADAPAKPRPLAPLGERLAALGIPLDRVPTERLRAHLEGRKRREAERAKK